ncbi:toll/interleukin-1 receptor domain-containing protein [Archangium lansingense]|uniref:toll/interleukin-1 receptor domain-containing protein n=1 Tax=Archangium lansingense TaxID=2995310 RepID=UPI003B7CD109
MATVFFSYSHADEALRDQLEKHLTMLKRRGLIETWHDRRIPAGDNFAHAIDQNLERADVILLLVSPDFLASNYCYDIELKRAMERHKAGEARVIPVILRPCDWHDSEFGQLLATPKDGKPVKSFPDLDEAFLQVTQAIKDALKAAPASAGRVPRAPAVSLPAGPPTRAPGPRSSNLRIRKNFTDAEKDRFKDEAFELMAKFFENSLAELKARNEGIDVNFKRIDANQFTATVYRDGKKRSWCRILVGPQSLSSGISYAGTESGINESVTVEADDERLFLKPLGMAMRSGGESHLTPEGAAEFYWELFMERLRH